MEKKLNQLQKTVLFGIFSDDRTMRKLQPWSQEAKQFCGTYAHQYFLATREVRLDPNRWLDLSPPIDVATRSRISHAYGVLQEAGLIRLAGDTDRKSTHAILTRRGVRVARQLMREVTATEG